MPHNANSHTTVIVNTRPRTWTNNKISYEQVVALAYPDDTPNPDITYTVRYSRGHDGHGTGTLTSAKTVAVKKGMVFDVVRTVRS
ncbi:multiubiquitin domain-containing protein [Propioniciclava sinopodophylli]|uniref:multiubiquitin domain-containing protein n=1 Tax=Propioniciclava sinopodophylli TaxID=1837344 RepID=UPI0013F17D36|nr:multiubiquitin domain-containing protein [Propioniciclava sinopodophylli]